LLLPLPEAAAAAEASSLAANSRKEASVMWLNCGRQAGKASAQQQQQQL
jgi:hypothetical protein